MARAIVVALLAPCARRRLRSRRRAPRTAEASRTCRASGRRSTPPSGTSRITPGARRPRRPGNRRRRRDSLSPGCARPAPRELQAPAHRRPRGEVLHGGRAANHVHAVPLPDRPAGQSGHDPLRVRPHRRGTSTSTARIRRDRSSGGWGIRAARWEGDTLVVDVVHFTDQTWFDRSGNYHSEACTWWSATRGQDPITSSTRRRSKIQSVFPAVEDQPAAVPEEERNMRMLEYQCYAYLEAQK